MTGMAPWIVRDLSVRHRDSGAAHREGITVSNGGAHGPDLRRHGPPRWQSRWIRPAMHPAPRVPGVPVCPALTLPEMASTLPDPAGILAGSGTLGAGSWQGRQLSDLHLWKLWAGPGQGA